jgi:hypothetical protein
MCSDQMMCVSELMQGNIGRLVGKGGIAGWLASFLEPRRHLVLEG